MLLRGGHSCKRSRRLAPRLPPIRLQARDRLDVKSRGRCGLQEAVVDAEAMAFRDAPRREAMTERDWGEIEGQLLRAYQLLKTGIEGS